MWLRRSIQRPDEAGDYLRQLADFSGDQLLVIHTNPSGEITKNDLDIAVVRRTAASAAS